MIKLLDTTTGIDMARSAFNLNLVSSTRAEVQVAKEYHSVLSCSEAPQRKLTSKLS